MEPFTGGPAGSLPIVPVVFIQADGTRIDLSLVFDTGASYTTLRADYFYLFGVTAWDNGAPMDVDTGGSASKVTLYSYTGELELYGRKITGPILLAQMPVNALYAGVLGRATFGSFGFGFWEKTRELFVTATP